MERTRRLTAGCAILGVVAAVSMFSQAPARHLPIRTFDRYLEFSELEQNSAGVSVGDLNGDGWLDIVLANGRHTPLHNRVLLNDTKGHFIRIKLDENAHRSYAAALADIDADGDVDIIVSTDTPDPKLIYKNDGKGRFTRAGTWGEPSWATRYLSTADINGDGYPDVVAANAGASMPLRIPYPSFVCFNDRKGGFPGCRTLPSESAVIIPVADFDGDGALDLFVPHRDGGRSFILWTDPAIVRSQTAEELAARGWMSRTPFRERAFIGERDMQCRVAAAGDLDGDSRTDLVLYDDEEKISSVFLNNGARTFKHPFTLSIGTRTPSALTVSDVNKDGAADIVIGYAATSTGSGSRGSVFFNAGGGRHFIETPWNDGKGTVYQVAVADVDKDGWPDIVAARAGAPSGIWFNTSPPSQQ